VTLRFLAHFVGDIHQPLHAGLPADRGGNEFKGLYNGKPTNMHRLWDIDLIVSDGRPWRAIADSLRASVRSQDRAAWIKAKPIDWGNESLAIARARTTYYVPHGDTFEFGEDYTRLNLPIALDRMRQAGIRLGAVLNDILR
jgi:hypothetical protein